MQMSFFIDFIKSIKSMLEYSCSNLEGLHFCVQVKAQAKINMYVKVLLE